ncbi:MAG: hypothetical protein NTV01_07815 [Bacteroidia bacterium]|nr:hypothetical protein [Bacteroidia bacterium]
MKLPLTLLLILLLVLTSCSQQEKSPLEGTWEPVKIIWSFPDSTKIEYPGNVAKCEGLWIFTKNDWFYAVNYSTNSDTASYLEGGPYNYDGITCQLTYKYSNEKFLIGQSFSSQLKVRNDTLIIIGPKKEEEERFGSKLYEVWVRKK